MKKIILSILIIIILLSTAIVLNMPLKYNRHLVPEPLYKYLIDSKLREKYKKYKICNSCTSKEACFSQPSCTWDSFWFDGMEKVEEHCSYK